MAKITTGATKAVLERALELAIEIVREWQYCDTCHAKAKNEDMYPCEKQGCKNLLKAHFLKLAKEKKK